MGKPFFVYILVCADGAYYTGHTDDIDRRLAEHEEGGWCAFTTARRPIRLVWCEEAQTREEAKEVEYQIKRWQPGQEGGTASGVTTTHSGASARKRFSAPRAVATAPL